MPKAKKFATYKKAKGAKRLRKGKKALSEDWESRHIEAVRPEIEKLDRMNAESLARAPHIAVSNSTKK